MRGRRRRPSAGVSDCDSGALIADASESGALSSGKWGEEGSCGAADDGHGRDIGG